MGKLLTLILTKYKFLGGFDMEDLDKIESLIWDWVNKDCIGRENAIDQLSLFRFLGFYPEFVTPLTFRKVRAIMRGLKQKRPILTSLKDPPGYYKPATWEEVETCLARRKYTAIRMLSLNKKMLEVCKPLFPEQVSEQLELFESNSMKEMLK